MRDQIIRQRIALNITIIGKQNMPTISIFPINLKPSTLKMVELVHIEYEL